MTATTHRMYVKRLVLPFIKDGSKDLEVRVNLKVFEKIGVGDTIIFDHTCQRRVKAIRRYPNFDEMLNQEDPARILPGMDRQRILKGLRQIYGESDRRHGVIIFELESF